MKRQSEMDREKWEGDIIGLFCRVQLHHQLNIMKVKASHCSHASL